MPLIPAHRRSVRRPRGAFVLQFLADIEKLVRARTHTLARERFYDWWRAGTAVRAEDARRRLVVLRRLLP